MDSAAEVIAEVIIVGAGAAGLATAASLQRLGIQPVVIEAGDVAGHSWASSYDALRLHTVRRYSSLPLRPMSSSYPRYASRDQIVGYLRDYAAHYSIDVRSGRRVERAMHTASGWQLSTDAGQFACRTLVAATGVVANPVTPVFPGMDEYTGVLMHSQAYRNAAAFAGKRVLVVGAGNSGAEIALDLMRGGARVTVAIRQGVNAVPLSLLGIPIQYWGLLVAKLPRAITGPLAGVLLRRSAARLRRAGIPKSPEPVLGSHGIPIIGLGFLDAAREKRIRIAGGIERFTREGIQFADGRSEPFDAVILATGYRPALDFLGEQITRDERGFPMRAPDGVRSADLPDLYFVGYTYSIAGTLNLIRQEAPVAARSIATSAQQRTKPPAGRAIA
jgi:thioredoxin reductase